MEKQNRLKKNLFSTPMLKVLDFLLQHPEVELNDTEIAGKLDTARKSAVNLALRKLASLGMINRVPRGRMVFNTLIESPIVTQLKVASNLMSISHIVEKIVPFSSRIVLFGSRADGTNDSESDFDLLVVTINEEETRRIIGKSPLAENIQLITKSPEQMLKFEEDEPVFSSQVKKGIVLWQRK